MQTPPRYLVATDGSPGGRDAVRQAVVLARESGAILSILYVRHAPRHRRVDMIIVGSRGRGAVVGTLLGSVSKAVVNGAACPVLVVRPPAAAGRLAA